MWIFSEKAPCFLGLAGKGGRGGRCCCTDACLYYEGKSMSDTSRSMWRTELEEEGPAADCGGGLPAGDTRVLSSYVPENTTRIM